MKTFHRTAWLALAAAVFLLAGCASSQSGSSYAREQTRGEMHVRLGVVESVRQVTIEGSKSGAGPMAGGVIGGIAGSNIGGGRGAVVGTVIGMVAGGMAGQAIEENVTKKNGLEITIKLDDGRMIAVTQEADEQFYPGDRVRVLSGRGATRVSR